jgi:hypothetical protein
VGRVADKAAVGEHRVVADLDQLERGQHRVAVEEAAGADLDPRPGRKGQPAARLQQRAFADPQASLVERLQGLALERPADEEATAGGVPRQAPTSQRAPVALIPAPLQEPNSPSPLPLVRPHKQQHYETTADGPKTVFI